MVSSRLDSGIQSTFTSVVNSSGQRTGPPRNPGLRELIQAKRRHSAPQSREDGLKGFRGWHERGYLPHFDKPNVTQFVTFRLADSFPAELRSEWAALLEIEEERDRRTQLEAYLDRGRGRCELRRTDITALMEDALLHFDGQRYQLRAWVVMPNHVHVLFHVNEVPMSEIVESWKSFSAKPTKCLPEAGSFGRRTTGTPTFATRSTSNALCATLRTIP